MEHGNNVYGYGYWPIVVGNVLFMAFLVLTAFKPRTKTDWKTFGSLGAFFIALFTEMYGFPFTIYLLSSWLGKKYPVVDPFSHDNGHLLQVFFGDSWFLSLIIHPGSDILLITALVIISIGWRKIYATRGELVTDGIYRYIRHPQYAGFMLIIFGLIVQWPTVITLVMGPLLIGIYNQLAKKEEKKMLELFGEEYEQYMKNTVKYFPFVAILKRTL